MLTAVVPFHRAAACTQPDAASIIAAFDLAADGQLPASYPQIPASTGVSAIPPSVLKAVGWVESNWRQFTPQGRPLLSFDFGYGIMQITSGMAGAFGSVDGSIDPAIQSRIATDYRYNIAYGAMMLAEKWVAVPQVGNGDPSVVEDWYYALWAYNGLGWANNPNNPRFSRRGTPLTNPSTFPYQERVLYLVAHPPLDANGDPLWQPVPVTLPSRKSIGDTPHAIPDPHTVHRQVPAELQAVYRPQALAPLPPGIHQTVSVRITNTGRQPWAAGGADGVALTYHLFTAQGNPFAPFSPFSPGVVAFGQGTSPLARVLLPGQSETVHTAVQAPATPGLYRVVWDLEAGNQGWFSQAGAMPYVEPLPILSGARQAPSPTPTAQPSAVPAEGLLYVADTSIPDGTILTPHVSIRKGWLVYNSGRTAWTPDWTVHLVSGSSFGKKDIPMPPTAPCKVANFVVTLRAPSKSGTYHSVWQLRDPAGHAVGDRLTLVVAVNGGKPRTTPTPVPTPSPTPARPMRPTPTVTPVG